MLVNLSSYSNFDQMINTEREREKVIKTLSKKIKLILLKTQRLSNWGTEYENHRPKHQRYILSTKYNNKRNSRKISEQPPVPSPFKFR